MTSRERMEIALAHSEPDRVPLDLGGTLVTGIHTEAYRRLKDHLGLSTDGTRVRDVVTQLAEVDEPILRDFGVDVRMTGLVSDAPFSDEGIRDGHRWLRDRFGITWSMPLRGGLYYDMRSHPLKGEVTVEDIECLALPPPPDRGALRQLRDEVVSKNYHLDYALTLASPGGAGVFELASWLRGYKDFFVDLARRRDVAKALLNRILEFKLAAWEVALDELGEVGQIALEADDLSTQEGPLISPSSYRELIKPVHQKLFSFIKQRSQGSVRVFIHSCGSVQPLIHDMIEAGVDILNPVQVSAANMDTRDLKRSFGKDIVFWGGGIDTQRVLPSGTTAQVRDEVRRRVDDLAPGGGFVFAAVHNIQPDVPPENILAMLQELRECGDY